MLWETCLVCGEATADRNSALLPSSAVGSGALRARVEKYNQGDS